MLKCCVLLGSDWVELMMFLMLHITCSCIFHAYVPSFLYILILNCLVLFYLSLSISLSFISWSMAPSRNPLCSETSSSSSPFNSTQSHIRFYDDKACKDFSKNFSWWGIHSECQVVLSDFSNTDLPTIIYSRGWESLCGIPITYPSVIIQEFYSNMHGFDYSVPHFVTRVRGTLIIVTLDIVSDVLHVPMVAHPDYPGCDRLRTVSKDELSSLFCETPSSWGDHKKTPCSGFAKGPRFLTWWWHLFSIHCLTITLSQSLALDFCYPFLRGLPLIFPFTSFYPL